MTEEEKEAFAELQAEVRGLRQVISIALAQLPRDIVLERLTSLRSYFGARMLDLG